MSRVLYAAVVAIAVLGSMACGASLQAKQAGLTGLDSLHEQDRVGGKTCMIEHEHGGEGALASKTGAAAAAIRHWESFTTWEYGKAWGSYRLAAGKHTECESAGSGWHCSTRARPCRR